MKNRGGGDPGEGGGGDLGKDRGGGDHGEGGGETLGKEGGRPWGRIEAGETLEGARRESYSIRCVVNCMTTISPT